MRLYVKSLAALCFIPGGNETGFENLRGQNEKKMEEAGKKKRRQTPSWSGHTTAEDQRT